MIKKLTNSVSDQIQSSLWVTAGAFMISFSAVFVKWAHVGPSVSAFYRMLFGGIILLGISIIRKSSFWKGRKPLLYAFLGAFFISVDLIMWHRSILFIGPGLATILGNFQVFFVGFIAVLIFKEKPTWKLLAAIPVAVAGLFLMVGVEWSQYSADYKWGLLLGLGAAFNYTFYILFLRHSQRREVRLSVFANLALISLFAALMLGISIKIHGTESFLIPDLQSWASLFGLGIVIQVMGWLFISRGLMGLDASVAGLLLLLQPALSFMWDILFFNRPTSAIEFTGAGVTLVAIYLGATGRKKLMKK